MSRVGGDMSAAKTGAWCLAFTTLTALGACAAALGIVLAQVIFQ